MTDESTLEELSDELCRAWDQRATQQKSADEAYAQAVDEALREGVAITTAKELAKAAASVHTAELPFIEADILKYRLRIGNMRIALGYPADI